VRLLPAFGRGVRWLESLDVATAEREREHGTSPGDVLKRVLVGRRLASHRLEHTLLPKVLALPVFSSDPLSSVAYATEEILVVLLAASVASAHLVMPIAVAIATLLVIVVISYRQTVRAYPRGGGSYIVSKDNLGTFAGLLAAAAILTDYVLTVAVSVVAGVFAITSAAPGLADHRVALSIGFVAFITLANLRGVRESGILFAIPTYGFVLSIYALLVSGFVRCVTGGCPAAVVPADHIAVGVAASVSLFILLHAFSSGATALTGVEAIADGVPAFRRPQAKNAATTLAIMGFFSVSMFLGISFLASRGHPIPSESKSVVAQLAEGVFHGGFMFYVVQVFTAGILILAANTSYQDFPRLSSILARDRFMPRQFENRGDRLVFSNGVIVLAVLASLLIYVFHAELSRLIQLYVVGVFTAFTLSQAGMVRHWMKIQAAGGAGRNWRPKMVINAIGATATFVVLVVVIATKFTHGAWIVIVAMPLIMLFFHGLHRHYERVWEQLRAGTVSVTGIGRNHVVLLVETLDPATAEAIGYVRSFAGREFRAIHVPGERSDDEVVHGWRSFSMTNVELELLEPKGSAVNAVIEYVRSIPREHGDFVTVVIPELYTKPSLLAAVRRETTFRLKVRLLREPDVVITDVPVLLTSGTEPEQTPLIRERTVALVLVSAAHDGTVRAVNYARSLRCDETRALYFAFEAQDIHEIQEGWRRFRIPVQLDIVEAPFRDLGPPILEEIRRVTSRHDSLATVVVPELVVRKWWHRLLHNQRPLFIKRLLLFEPRTILSSVPLQLK
jgi:amino acid transporter